MRYVVLAVVLLGTLLLPARQAFACSVGPAPTIDILSEEAAVIASGTLVNGTEDTITLQVEEYFKGDIRYPEIVLNNHHFSNDPSCTPVIGEGRWLPEGVRVLAFLRVDEFGLAEMRPAGLVRQYIFKIPDDPTHEMVFADGEQPLMPFEAARAALAELYGPAAAPDAASGGGGGFGTGGGGVDGNVGGGVVDGGVMPAPPTVAPHIDPMPPMRDDPLPVEEPAIEPIAPAVEQSASTSGQPTLPRILLGVLVTITLLLALWAVVMTLRRRRSSEQA